MRNISQTNTSVISSEKYNTSKSDEKLSNVYKMFRGHLKGSNQIPKKKKRK